MKIKTWIMIWVMFIVSLAFGSHKYPLSKQEMGMSDVDNTSDANKPISTLVQAALNLKVDKTTTVNGQALSGNVNITIPAAQVAANWTETNTGLVSYVQNKPELWRLGVRKLKHIEYLTSAVTASGSVTFNLTDDGTATGNAIFNTLYKESVNFWVESNLAAYQFGGYTFSGNKKQLTISVTRLGSTSTILSLVTVLTGITFVTPADGITVYATIKGE